MKKDRIIAITGATGAQGGGLARSILMKPDSGWKVRALTRSPEGEAAGALARLGADVIRADVEEPASLERAFAGADAAFCVTFYWTHQSGDRELMEAQNLARAAKSARVGHVVWSTMEDTRRFVPPGTRSMPTLQGRYKVPHFDAKGAADGVFAELDVPTTYMVTSFQWEDFVRFGLGPKPDADGDLVLTLPMGDRRLSGVSVADVGAFAHALFEQGGALVGARIGLAGEHLRGEQMAASLTRALGVQVRYRDVSPEAYRAFGFPGAEELGNMFEFLRDFETECVEARDVVAARRLHPGLATFDEWLAANAPRIPISRARR